MQQATERNKDRWNEDRQAQGTGRERPGVMNPGRANTSSMRTVGVTLAALLLTACFNSNSSSEQPRPDGSFREVDDVRIAVDDAGRFVIAYEQIRRGSDDDALPMHELVVLTYDGANGATLGEDIVTSGAPVSGVDIDVTAGGQGLVTWAEQERPDVRLGHTLRQATATAGGNGYTGWGAAIRELETVPELLTSGGALQSAAGESLTLWSDRATGFDEIIGRWADAASSFRFVRRPGPGKRPLPDLQADDQADEASFAEGPFAPERLSNRVAASAGPVEFTVAHLVDDPEAPPAITVETFDFRTGATPRTTTVLTTGLADPRLFALLEAPGDGTRHKLLITYDDPRTTLTTAFEYYYFDGNTWQGPVPLDSGFVGGADSSELVPMIVRPANDAANALDDELRGGDFDQLLADVGMDAAGNVLFVYALADGRIVARRFDAAALSWDTGTAIVASGAVGGAGFAQAGFTRIVRPQQDQSAPLIDLAVNAAGQAVAIWESADTAGNEQNRAAAATLQVSRYAPGSGWSAPATLSADARRPSLTRCAAAYAVLDAGDLPAEGQQRQRFCRRAVHTSQVAIDAAGRAVVAWTQLIDRNGNVGPVTGPLAGPQSSQLVVTDLGTSQAQPPTASFVVSPDMPSTDDDVSFDATGSTAAGSITDYEWDFEDDGTVDDSGAIVVHRYAAAGSYEVRLRVTDNAGLSAETTRFVNVTGPSVGDGASGNYAGRLVFDGGGDPSQDNAAFLDLPAGGISLTLSVTISGNRIDITGPAPFVNVGGLYDPTNLSFRDLAATEASAFNVRADGSFVANAGGGFSLDFNYIASSATTGAVYRYSGTSP